VYDGYVDEKGRDHDWKSGKPLDYSLTKKEKEAAISNAIGNMEENTRILVESFARMRDIYGTIPSNPNVAQDYKSMLVEAVSAELREKLPSKKQLREQAKASAKLERPLIQSYLNMHRLLCQILGFEGCEANVLFGIDENGKLRAVTEK